VIRAGSRVRCITRLYDRVHPTVYSVDPGTVGQVVEVEPMVSDGQYVANVRVALVMFTLETNFVFCTVNTNVLREVWTPMATYEPPTVAKGSVCTFGEESLLAEGVRGYAVVHNDLIYIPLIIAAREGSGDVGRFLDSLSPRCRVASVTSPKLAGMLARRGWEPHIEEGTDVWRRA
jgi:hypothetical protein